MEKKAEHLKSIDARIRELEQSIREREAELKQRAGRFREELQAGLTPEEIVRKYPLQAAGGSLLAGFLAGKIIRSILSPSSQKTAPPPDTAQNKPSGLRSALGTLGIDVLHSGKDLAFTYLKHYLDNRMKSKQA